MVAGSPVSAVTLSVSSLITPLLYEVDEPNTEIGSAPSFARSCARGARAGSLVVSRSSCRRSLGRCRWGSLRSGIGVSRRAESDSSAGEDSPAVGAILAEGGQASGHERCGAAELDEITRRCKVRKIPKSAGPFDAFSSYAPAVDPRRQNVNALCTRAPNRRLILIPGRRSMATPRARTSIEVRLRGGT